MSTPFRPSDHTALQPIETTVGAKARRARELYVALLAQGFTEDQAVDLVGATLIGDVE